MDAMSDFPRHELAHVARRYYVDSLSKVEIAEEMGLSRFKVARMLEQAHASGIVTITVDAAGVVVPDLSVRLRSHLGLEQCLVVQGRETIAELREDVGSAAADLLTRTLRPGDILGFAWGRTLTAMTERLTKLPPVTVVQLTGAVGSDLADSPVEVIRRVSLRSGGNAHAIFAPLVLEDVTTASALRRQPDIARAMELFDKVDVAVVAVGSWDPPISQLRELLPQDEQDRLRAHDVQAEVAATLITSTGELIPGFTERCLSITSEQLSRVPHVIAVAAEREKANAIHAVTRSGMISALVTEQRCAEELLALPPVSRRAV